MSVRPVPHGPTPVLLWAWVEGGLCPSLQPSFTLGAPPIPLSQVCPSFTCLLRRPEVGGQIQARVSTVCPAVCDRGEGGCRTQEVSVRRAGAVSCPCSRLSLGTGSAPPSWHAVPRGVITEMPG